MKAALCLETQLRMKMKNQGTHAAGCSVYRISKWYLASNYLKKTLDFEVPRFIFDLKEIAGNRACLVVFVLKKKKIKHN